MFNARNLRENRRYGYVCITTAAAILSPPDPISMVAIMLPMFTLYEIAILICERVDRS